MGASRGTLSALHVVYGLRLATNKALPGLPLQRDSETPDLLIKLRDRRASPATLPAFDESFCSNSNDGPGGQPNLRFGLFPGGEYFGFFCGDGVQFAIEHRGREVWADWPEKDRKSTRLNSSHRTISYAVFCLKK